MTAHITTCPGFNEHTGTCTNGRGHPGVPNQRPPSHIWCERCDRLRLDHITKRLEGIVTNYEKRSGEVTP